jgi:hypothetical protein
MSAQFLKKISKPLWLNADILPGPVNDTTEPISEIISAFNISYYY